MKLAIELLFDDYETQPYDVKADSPARSPSPQSVPFFEPQERFHDDDMDISDRLDSMSFSKPMAAPQITFKVQCRNVKLVANYVL
jgi:hypothetical protein